MNRELLEATTDFFRCPNTGKIIEGMKGDDKVFCGCGKSNPTIKTQEAVSGGVHHIRRFLSTATVQEYIDQEEARHLALGSVRKAER